MHIPVIPVSFGGRPRVRSGSNIANEATHTGFTLSFPRDVQEITVMLVTSLPVPLVVGINTIGTPV